MARPFLSVRTLRSKLERLDVPRRVKIWRPTLELLEARGLLSVPSPAAAIEF